MKHQYPKEIFRPTSHEQVVFKDGMIVTAEDLQAASNYSLGIFQTLIRAFFGCGIVCGLKVDFLPQAQENKGLLDAADANSNNGWCVQIQPGVALDCQGYPLELCQAVTIDLTPDPCHREHSPLCVYVAIRRYIEADPQTKSGCSGSESVQSLDCTRKREQVLIKVFEKEKLPVNTCMRPVESQYEQDPCDCLKACPEHNCCGEGWVLLACINISQDQCGIESIDDTQRKYVKPIECYCRPPLTPSVAIQDKVIDNSAKAVAEPVAGKPASRNKTNPNAIKK
jgi:hypothetical protein